MVLREGSKSRGRKPEKKEVEVSGKALLSTDAVLIEPLHLKDEIKLQP